MAEEFLFDDPLVLVRRMTTGDITGPIDAGATWTDISEDLFAVSLVKTRNSVRFPRTRSVPRGRVRAAGGDGTVTLSGLVRHDAGTGGTRFFDLIDDDTESRFQVLIQPFREPLLTGANDAPVPDASEDNPQHVGSAIMTSYNKWGNGGETDPAAFTVVADIDSDFRTFGS